MFCYPLLGLTLRCAHPLPLLKAGPLSDERTLEVELGVPPELAKPANDGLLIFESQIVDEQGEPTLRIWRRDREVYRFSYTDGSEFFIDSAGRRVWARWVSPSTLEDVTVYLAGPVLGFALRLRGVLCIHASAVVIDGLAVALAGPAGAGKSTMAAAFAQQGFPVLSDDAAALKPAANGFLVQADSPHVRLWPSSSEMLGGSADSLPRLSPTWDKRFMDLEEHGYRFERSPRLLAAVYLLCGEPVGSKPVIRELRGQSAFLAILANTYANRALEPHMRAAEFDLLGRLIPALRVRRLHKPAAGLSPIHLCDFIAADFRRLPPTAAI